MSTNSFVFLVFVAAVFALFYIIKGKLRWALLLLASFIFYASQKAPHLLLALSLVILINYGWGLKIQHSKKERQKKTWLVSGIILNGLVLFGFRYLPLLLKSFPSVAENPGWSFLDGLLTVGISFFVLQAISYLIDIYLEVLEPENHLGYFALYLSFFPKLIQGPIERGGDLLPQLRSPYQFDYERMRLGFWKIERGLFKKLVLADRLALFVNAVYDQPQNYFGLPLILATYLYALQIYFDFSAYTDIALGVAGMFGIRLTDNFNSPYLADSIPEFWRRWHISFSRWILDYIFKPIQLSLRNWQQWGSAIALMITFLFSGIWHGASWGYLIWGGLHGIYMVCSMLFGPLTRKTLKRLKLDKSKPVKVMQVFFTFNLVSFSWIFFRTRNLADASYIVTHVYRGVGSSWRQLLRSFTPQFSAESFQKFLNPYLMGQDVNSAMLLLALLLVALVMAIFHSKPKLRDFPLNQPTLIRWGVYYLTVFAILFMGVFASYQFIYNQF